MKIWGILENKRHWLKSAGDIFGIIGRRMSKELWECANNAKWWERWATFAVRMKSWRIYLFVNYFIGLLWILQVHYLKPNQEKKIILVAINHYSKWCEAKAVVYHGAKTTNKFLEDEIISKYGVPKFVLIDNGGEWATQLDVMCRDYGIHHQHTTHGYNVMGWLNVCSKLLSMASSYSLKHQKMWIIGMNNWPKSCLDIDAGFKPTLSFLLSW